MRGGAHIRAWRLHKTVAMSDAINPGPAAPLEQLRELAEIPHEVFWLANTASTEVVYVSPAYEAVFGRSCASLYADAYDWINALHPDDRARMLAFAMSAPGESQRARYRVARPDGSSLTLDLRVLSICNGDLVLNVADFAGDITALLRLEEQVRQTQKLESLGLLAGGIAHDFNNILAVIAANASFLRETASRSEADNEVLHEICEAVHRGTAMTHQLLAFSRKQAVVAVVLDLNAAINDTRKMLRRMVGEDIVIATSLEPDLGHARIDPGCLVQVLMNLAVNARDAMPRGGTLTIATRSIDPHEVMISMTDTGCGMSKDVKARAFEPLFTTKELGKGTGLGLSVVHGIVQQAGGRIEIESEIGVGTTLRIILPCAGAEDQRQPSAPAIESRGDENLIVVEDDPYVRTSISRALRARGYGVLEAGSAPAALALLREHGNGIDLLVTDVVMPGMDGHQLVETARRSRPSLDVLYISGYTDDAVVRHGVARSDVALLEKPFASNALAERVRQILDAAKSLRS
jgi:signal transduction histidine kinase/CheY-like chemotaxis protein